MTCAYTCLPEKKIDNRGRTAVPETFFLIRLCNRSRAVFRLNVAIKIIEPSCLPCGESVRPHNERLCLCKVRAGNTGVYQPQPDRPLSCPRPGSRSSCCR